MHALIAAVLLSLSSPARADCLFDGGCAPRPAASVPAVFADDDAVAAGTPAPSRLSGLSKGASEGALLGFYAGIYPAVALTEEGFGRRMSRSYDGPSGDNGNGRLYYYGGIALGVLLYIPALVLGGIGGLFGGAAGAAAPEEAKEWDAERFLFDDRRR